VTVYPEALITDFGEVNVDSIGDKVVEIEQTLDRGIYWLVVVANATVVIEGNIAEAGLSYSVDFPYAPLPQTFPSGAIQHEGDIPAFSIHEVGT
jgi:hypothetical protein